MRARVWRLAAAIWLGLCTQAFAQMQFHASSPTPVNGKPWTSASSTTVTSDTTEGDQGGAFQVQVVNESYAYVTVKLTSPAFTAGNVCLEGDDGTGLPPGSDGSAPTANWTKDLGQIPVANLISNRQYGPISIAGLRRFRVRLCTAITGTGTFTFWVQVGTTDGSRVRQPVVPSPLTTTNLVAAAAFTSEWFDTRIDGVVCVHLSTRADVASGNNGFLVQTSDAPTDANFNQIEGLYPGTVAANTTTSLTHCPRARFWRVSYTNNGSTGQTSFKLAAHGTDAQTFYTAFDGSIIARDWDDIPLARTEVRFYGNGLAAGATTVENLPTITRSVANNATGTGTSWVVTSGKKYRITSIKLTQQGNNTATDTTTVFRLRVATAGSCGTGSTPIVHEWRVFTSAAKEVKEIVIEPDKGIEVGVGDGTYAFCITTNATYTTNAPTFNINLNGFEYAQQ